MHPPDAGGGMKRRPGPRAFFGIVVAPGRGTREKAVDDIPVTMLDQDPADGPEAADSFHLV
jgi:hypothetical protein